MRKVLITTVFFVALAGLFAARAGAADEKMRDLQFPRDAGGHKADTEWWYINGHLKDAAGNEYGIMAAFFKVEQMGTRVYFDMLGATDVANKKHYSISTADKQSAEMARGIVEGMYKKDPSNTKAKELLDYYAANEGRITLAGPFAVKNDRLSVNYGGNHMEQPSPDKLDFDVFYAFDDVAVKMNMAVKKPPMPVGGRGYIDMAAGGKSYYYSLTRIDASGTITIGGREIPVSGLAWMDHQWGNWDGGAYKGWDWFCVQLDNGMDFNLFSFRGKDGAQIDATATMLDGDKTVVSKKMELVAHDKWTNPASGTTYPLGWTIRLPEQDITFEIEPVVIEQEMFLMRQYGAIWEGNTRVTATVGGKKVTGVGYAELTGYAPGMMDFRSK